MWVKPHEHKLVGRILAEVREQAGLTQIDLAKRLGVPQSFVSRLETGYRRTDVLELVRIAGALDADPGKLFGKIVAARAKE